MQSMSIELPGNSSEGFLKFQGKTYRIHVKKTNVTQHSFTVPRLFTFDVSFYGQEIVPEVPYRWEDSYEGL